MLKTQQTLKPDVLGVADVHQRVAHGRKAALHRCVEHSVGFAHQAVNKAGVRPLVVVGVVRDQFSNVHGRWITVLKIPIGSIGPVIDHSGTFAAQESTE